jgi:hypothetical protein
MYIKLNGMKHLKVEQLIMDNELIYESYLNGNIEYCKETLSNEDIRYKI